MGNGAVDADRKGLDFHGEHADLLGGILQPAAVGEQLGRGLADLLAHVLAVEAHERDRVAGLVLDAIVGRNQDHARILRGFRNRRPDGLIRDGDGDALGAGGDGVVHQAHAQVRVELGVELLGIRAQLTGGRDEGVLQVDEVLLIGALVDRDEQRLLARGRGRSGAGRAVGQRDRIHGGLEGGRIHDGGRGEGDGRRRLAVDDRVVQHGRGGLADVEAGDEQAGLEAGRLPGGPRLAGFVGAEADADDVVGLDARGGERVQGTQDAFVIAAEDDPVGHVRVRGDDRAGRVLRRQRLAGVRHGEDLRIRHARGLDRRLLIVGAVVADREGLDLDREDADLLGGVLQPAAVGEQLGRGLADLLAHVLAVEAHERDRVAGLVHDAVVGRNQDHARILGRFRDRRPDGLIRDGDGDALGAGGDGVVHQAHAQVRVELGVELLGVRAQLTGGRDEGVLQVDEVLLIGALVDRDEQRLAGRLRGRGRRGGLSRCGGRSRGGRRCRSRRHGRRTGAEHDGRQQQHGDGEIQAMFHGLLLLLCE